MAAGASEINGLSEAEWSATIKLEESEDESTLSDNSIPLCEPNHIIKMEDVDESEPFMPEDEENGRASPLAPALDLPSNVNFAGVINCKETRLYPSSKAASVPAPKHLPEDGPKLVAPHIVQIRPVKQYTRQKPTPPLCKITENVMDASDVTVELVGDKSEDGSDEEQGRSLLLKKIHVARSSNGGRRILLPASTDIRLKQKESDVSGPNGVRKPVLLSNLPIESPESSPSSEIRRCRPQEVPPPPSLTSRTELRDSEALMEVPPLPPLTRKPNEEELWPVEYLDDVQDESDEEEKESKIYYLGNTVISRQTGNQRKRKSRKRDERELGRNPKRVAIGFRCVEGINNEIKPVVGDADDVFVFAPVARKEAEKSTGRKVAEAGNSTGREVQNPLRKPLVMELLTIESMAAMLKQVVKDPWTVVVSYSCLQLLHIHSFVGRPSIIDISLILSQNGEMCVYVYGKRVGKDHVMWQAFTEEPTLSTYARVAFILQVVAWLLPQRVCERVSLGLNVPDCDLLVLPPSGRCSKCNPRKTYLKKTERPAPLASIPSAPKVPDEDVQAQKPLGALFQAMLIRLKTEMENLAVEEGTVEKILVTQEEVLGSMGLRRRDSVDRPVRKSKREKKPSGIVVGERAGRREELEFLNRSWQDLEDLFTGSLHFGTYTTMGPKKLREGYQQTLRQLSRWHKLTGDNPGFLSDITVSTNERENISSMSADELRTALCSSVREINKLKRKLKSCCPFFSKLLRSEVEAQARAGNLDVLFEEMEPPV